MLPKPKNSYALAVLLLIENYTSGVNPAKYMKEFFHKFPWRIKELAEKHPTLTYLNNTTEGINRCGKVCHYKTIVPTCHISYLRNLYLKVNEGGSKK